ncbi:YicC/YloC family endoribonuclease [Halobacillus mangrovi]|uniref:YicC family protein n=1 Tax=Halobacillus mangrovi TaxID=402384 RepID=A0A1W5ZWA8_9BACI|nr:YicC/YloC family endoribonuclease [Halobacillus mangrovi]ARI77537.1 YicC family protein [Halobacillus mangrovi]
MVKSMTGYGKKSIEVGETRLHVEIRSVNHRYLDISAKLPRNLLFIEEKLKRKIREVLSRGRIDLFITVEGQSIFEKKVDVDWRILDQYLEKLKGIKARYDLTEHISIDMVTKLEDVFSVQEIEENTNELQEALTSSMEDALNRVIVMRKAEGERLKKDLLQRISKVSSFLEKLEERRPWVVEEYKERIRARIEEYTREEIQLDDTRILQEVGILAEKGDVTEEITRMHSHLSQFSQILTLEEPIGRRLDFIVQEMHREVNTIGSKSNDAKLTEWVVDLKNEIEKMKEQVQNVE